MYKQLMTGVALVVALGLGWSGVAQAQVSAPCSPEMIARLGSDPNPANGGEGCELWRHGLGNAIEAQPADFTATHVFFRTGTPPFLCGPENEARSNPIKGVLTFEEPKDAVCDVQTAGAAGCPARLFGGGKEGADQLNRSWNIVAGRNPLGFITINNTQHISFDGSEGTRYACDAAGVPNTDMNNLIDECSGTTPGKTFIRFHTDNPLSDFDNDQIAYDQNGVGDGITTGSAQCCIDAGNSNCEDLAGANDFGRCSGDPFELCVDDSDCSNGTCGGLTRPVVNQFGGHRAMTPVVFEGGKGSGFRHSKSQHNPIQEWGSCFQNRDRACTRTCETCTAGDTFANCQASAACHATLVGPCSDVTDVCDYSERGLVVGAAAHLNDQTLNIVGVRNQNRCAAAYIDWIGSPVDIGGTGRSTGCWVPTFYDPDGYTRIGCLVTNFGPYALPDLDCDGVWDDLDGSGSPGPDKCAFFSEINPFLDTNGDGIGDECQCGDGNGDGAVSNLDIGAAALCANGVGPPACRDTTPTILDADGDGTTSSLDIGGIVAVVNGDLTTAELSCNVNQQNVVEP